MFFSAPTAEDEPQPPRAAPLLLEKAPANMSRELVFGYAAGLTAGVAIGVTLANFDLMASLRCGQFILRRQPTILQQPIAVEAMAAAALAPTSGLLALPAELIIRILAELPMRDLTRMVCLSCEFRDSLVQQTMETVSPQLSGLAGPRRHLRPGRLRQWHLQSLEAAHLVAKWRKLSVLELTEWGEELAEAEALLSGRLTPGEYHYFIRTADDEGTHSYDAYGSLWCLPDGSVRGSAVEVAPDGVTAAFTRNARWRAGTGEGLDDQGLHLTPYTDEEGRFIGRTIAISAIFRDKRRPMIMFDYDYAGEIYDYKIVAQSCQRPTPGGHLLSEDESDLLPSGWKQYGPQLQLTGRWTRREHEPGEQIGPIERGKVEVCKLWRAEWPHQLLPDDANAIEARFQWRNESYEDGAMNMFAEIIQEAGGAV